MNNGVDPTLLRRMERGAASAGALAAALGAAVLIGWIFDVPSLKHVLPGLAAMKINTAVSLLLLGAALWIRARSDPGSIPDRVADALCIFIGLIALLTLVEYTLGVDLRIDSFLGRDEISATVHPGRMSIATAACLLLMAAALTILDAAPRTSQVLAAVVLLVALLGLIGYTYGIRALYGTSAYATMAVHTAAGLCILSLGHLMARPRRCVHALLTRDTVGGTTARRLLPATVLVPLIVGWFRLKGQQLGYYDTEFGLALFVLANIIILAALVWSYAEQVDKGDARRPSIEADRDDLLAREQSARQRAETAVRARDQFLSIVSHELRTPLTPVLLIATALENRGDLPADAVEDIAAVREQIQIEARLIDDLLDLVRLGQGKMILRREVCDLHEVARKAAALFALAYGVKQVNLELDLRAPRSRVRCDPDRLQQILRNLLENALKFTPAGGTVRIISATRDAADDGDARTDPITLTIADSGIGIAAGEIDRVFDAFEQGDPSLTRKFSGLGIGLTISKRLIELQGGTLRAASAGVDQGSSFSLELPLCLEEPIAPAAPAPAPPPAQPPAQPPLEQHAANALRILIVEDNAETVRALDRLLRSHGHQTAIAGTGGQAMEIIAAGPIDLLISDIGLPDMSGWELMRLLREKHAGGDGANIRGIALSGFVTEEDSRRSREAGFIEHLGKPIELNRLLAAIDSATTTIDAEQ